MAIKKAVIVPVPPPPDHRTKIIILLVVVIIVLVLLYTLFGRNKKTDSEYQKEITILQYERDLGNLRMAKQDSLIGILADKIGARNETIAKRKEKIKQLDKEINETIPNAVRDLSKDSLRSAATNE